MHEFVVNVVKRIVVTAKSKVAFLIKPYYWRVEVFN